MALGYTIEMRPRTYCHGVAARHVKVQRALTAAAKTIHSRAEARLASVRATGWKKVSGPEHVTTITTENATGKYGHLDRAVSMYGTNPMAIEFGHTRSGYFSDPKYKSPDGEYILSGAAGLFNARGGSPRAPSKTKKTGRGYKGRELSWIYFTPSDR